MRDDKDDPPRRAVSGHDAVPRGQGPTWADEHGYLVRRHLFVGPAWCEREVYVLATWAEQVATLNEMQVACRACSVPSRVK